MTVIRPAATRPLQEEGHPSGPLPMLPPLPPRRAWPGWGLLASAAGIMVPLIPLIVMVRPVLAASPRLPVYGGQVLGLSATLCLIACLAVTPVTRVTRWKRAAWWRRQFGLCVFSAGAAGLVIAAVNGPRADWGMRVSGSARIWTGTVIVLALIPLAITSNALAQKVLAAHWKAWQRRLTWAVWALVAVHMAALAVWQCETAFWLASGPLLAARIPAVRRDLSRWRASGYEDSARWILAGAAAGVLACGITVLVWLEAVACVQAARLTA